MGLRVPAVVSDVHMTMEDGQPVLVIKWDLNLGVSEEMSFPTYDLGDIAETIGVPAVDLMREPGLLLYTAWIAEWSLEDEDWLFDFDEEN